MERTCPRCNYKLALNCYVKNRVQLDYFELIVKDENLRKTAYDLNTAFCPKCGYVEMWIDLDAKKEIKNEVKKESE